MNIVDRLLEMHDAKATSDENRTIRFVQERKNVWRVVYAD
jgi:uncharacterized protein YkuJ